MNLTVTLFTLFAAAPLAAQQPAPAESANPVQSPGNAVWASTPDVARRTAASENKMVFVEFDGGPECGHCQRMDFLLYPAFEFEALLIPMVPVKILLDSPEGKELARRYEIERAPATLISTPEGRLVSLIQGFTNAPEFYRQVQSDVTAYRQFARRVDAQDIAKLPAREALETGVELFQRSDPGAALPRLRRAVSAPKAPPEIRDEAREQLAAVELELKQPAAARATIAALLGSTKDAKRRERAEIFRAQLPLHEGKPAEALRLLQKFVADHPSSPYASDVEAIIKRLSSPPTNS